MTKKNNYYDNDGEEQLAGYNCPHCGYPMVIEEGLTVCYKCGYAPEEDEE